MQVAGYGEPLRLVDVPVPEPGPGELLIEVHRAGVNFPDMLLIAGRYQARPEPPFGPGFEVAGRVATLGEGTEGFTVGDRVMAFVEHGGYAEAVVAAASAAIRIPDGVTDDQAAVSLIAYGTNYHALVDRAQLQSGEVLVVLGAAGGVGSTAVELGARLGATVIGCVGAAWKGDVVRSLGAAHVIDYSVEDVKARVREITDGRGADVVYDPVGGDAFEEALRYTAYQGRLLVIGFTSGRIPEIPANRLLLNELSAVGVFWGLFAQRRPEANRTNMAVVLDMLARGELAPVISQVQPLEEAPRALELLAERKVAGKLVLAVR